MKEDTIDDNSAYVHHKLCIDGHYCVWKLIFLHALLIIAPYIELYKYSFLVMIKAFFIWLSSCDQTIRDRPHNPLLPHKIKSFQVKHFIRKNDFPLKPKHTLFSDFLITIIALKTKGGLVMFFLDKEKSKKNKKSHASDFWYMQNSF